MHTTSAFRPVVTTIGHTYAMHRTHYTAAMAFILSHGRFAALTKDGLLAMADVCRVRPNDEYMVDRSDDDRWLEVPMVFQVDEDGMVSSREVREWLGY